MRDQEELANAIAEALAKGTRNVKQIARAVGCDPRTVRAHLRKNALDGPQSQMGKEPSSDIEETQQRALDRLKEIIADPGTPPSGVVAAFNALSEAEAWNVRATELSEPRDEDEAVERMVALIEALPDSVRKRVLAQAH